MEVAGILPLTLTDLQLLSRYLLVIICAFCSSENTQLFTWQFHYVLVHLCLMQKLTPCVSDFAANIDTISISAKVGMRTAWAYPCPDSLTIWKASEIKIFLIWFVNPTAFTSVLISCAIWCLLPHWLWKYWVSQRWCYLAATTAKDWLKVSEVQEKARRGPYIKAGAADLKSVTHFRFNAFLRCQWTNLWHGVFV